MIKLAGVGLIVVCDTCEVSSLLFEMPSEVLDLMREAMGSIHLEAIGLGDTPSVKLERAASIARAATGVTDDLPAAWEREFVGDVPWVTCPSCAALGARADSSARHENHNHGGAL